MNKLKVSSEPEIYKLSDRFQLNNITKALWKNKPIEERKPLPGGWADYFSY